MSMEIRNTQGDTRGAGLIEVVVGTAIIAVSIVGILAALNLFVRAGLGTTADVQATFIAEEGLEVMRGLRDGAWSNIDSLASGTAYHLARVGGAWEATTTAQTVDEKFTRTVTIDDVYRRDSDDDIVPATSTDPNTLDPDTKKVTVSVSWGVVDTTHVAYTGGDTNGDLASFPSNDAGDGNPVQSFTTPSEAVTVTGLEVLLARASGTNPSDIYAEIRSGSSVGTVLATSETVTAADFDTELAWKTFTFPGSVELSADTTYYIRLRSDPPSTAGSSGSSGTVHWGYKQTASSPYAGGVARRYVGRQGDESDTGQLLDQYDFSFRVIETGRGGSVEAVTYLANLFE